MKGLLKFAFSALLAALLLLFSCADPYAEIESTEEELAVVAKIGDAEVYYEELRFLTVTTKNAMATAKGVDWSDPEDAAEYADELETMVWGNLMYNYGIFELFDKAYGFYDGIEEGLNDEIKSFIDGCGGRSEYIKYLEENALTDRLVRFNMKASLCELELLNYYSQVTGEIDTSYESLGDFLLGEESGTGLIRVVHICIEGDSQDSYELALELRGRMIMGEDPFALAEQYSSDYAELGDSGEYISAGDYHTDYEAAAFSLVVGEISDVLLIDSDHYVICRLEKEMSYISENYDTLYQKYLYTEFDKIVDPYIAGLKLEKTELGESLDLVSMS